MPDVVFIHGLYQALGLLRGVPFPARGRVLVVDLLGFGEHAGAVPPLSLHAQVEHVAAELDRHGIAKAVIVGHSVGGAVAMLLAASHPDRVASVVNVEGNFTLADAFWSSKLAAMTPAEAEAVVAAYRRDQCPWFTQNGIEPTPRRVEWIRRMFDAAPARAVQALAKAAVEGTSRPDYLPRIERVPDLGIPVHLFAGERSRAAWSVPDSFVRRAASFTTQPGVGHMMPIEEPEEFLALVAAVLR